jgi:hypothetical protein
MAVRALQGARGLTPLTLPAIAAHLRAEGWHLERQRHDGAWAAFQDGRHLPATAYRRLVVMARSDGVWLVLIEHRAPGYVRDLAGLRHVETLMELDLLVATAGLKSIPFDRDAVGVR